MSRDEIPPPPRTASDPPEARVVRAWAAAIGIILGSVSELAVVIGAFVSLNLGTLTFSELLAVVGMPMAAATAGKWRGKGGGTVSMLIAAAGGAAVRHAGKGAAAAEALRRSITVVPLALWLSSCGLLGGQGGHSFPELHEMPKIREDLGRCEQHVIDAVASYRDAIQLASAACTYAAAQEFAAVACELAEHVSVPVAETINTARPATPAACEGLRRSARAADLTLRSAAAWRSVYDWGQGLYAGGGS